MVTPLNFSTAISIHAPRGGSDFCGAKNLRRRFIFQSTLPVGGATAFNQLSADERKFQSTLPVGGATQRRRTCIHLVLISIHAPRGGSDVNALVVLATLWYFNPRSPWGERHRELIKSILSMKFQSTLPVGGATGRISSAASFTGISIHAPRGGSDL